MPCQGCIVMTKELSEQREVNYAFCHTVTMNLMRTESRNNNLSKAAYALLSTLPVRDHMEILNTGDTEDRTEDAKTCLSRNIIKSPQIYQD